MKDEITEMLDQISNAFTASEISDIQNHLNRQHNDLLHAMTGACIGTVNVNSSLSKAYNIVEQKLDVKFIHRLIEVALKDRPLDIVKNVVTFKMIFVLSLVMIAFDDYENLKSILNLYGCTRLYVVFKSRLKICNADIMRLAVEELSYKSIIKKQNGSYESTVNYIMSYFYTDYLEPVIRQNKPNKHELVQKLIIVFDYARTRIKEVLGTLIKSYYQVYQNADKYQPGNIETEKKNYLYYYNKPILTHFFMILKSEIQHPTFHKGRVPEEAAKCLCSGYLKHSSEAYDLLMEIIKMFDFNINEDPCSSQYAMKIRELYSKKKCVPVFEKLDDLNKKILVECKLEKQLRWLSSFNSAVRSPGNIYKLSTRTYIVFILYKSITDVVCKDTSTSLRLSDLI